MPTADSFQISPLPLEPFLPYFSLEDEELLERGARRCQVSSKPGFPCRVSLRDAEVGETVILLPFVHHEVDSPYRASGPIYVRKGAEVAELAVGEIPEVVFGRQLSLRAYDRKGLMRNAAVLSGDDLAEHVTQHFANPKVAYLHLHNALPGCYSCRVDRVE